MVRGSLTWPTDLPWDIECFNLFFFLHDHSSEHLERHPRELSLLITSNYFSEVHSDVQLNKSSILWERQFKHQMFTFTYRKRIFMSVTKNNQDLSLQLQWKLSNWTFTGWKRSWRWAVPVKGLDFSPWEISPCAEMTHQPSPGCPLNWSVSLAYGLLHLMWWLPNLVSLDQISHFISG